jgi:ComF family protein
MALTYTDHPVIVKLYQAIMQSLYPSECLVCGNEGEWLCMSCASRCIKITALTCPFCNRISDSGKTCPRCRNLHSLTGARSIWYYKEPIKHFIHRYKYEGVTAARESIVPRLADCFKELPLRSGAPMITCVPSRKSRLIEQGYNQSELLAQAVSRLVGHSYISLLNHKQTGTAQVKLTRKERLAQIQDRFIVRKNAPDITNRTVVIIDDVITTGGTLSGCASALKRAGARSVWAITIAKD